MSYYFGLIDEDLVLMCSDRTKVYYPEKSFESHTPRYFRPFQNIIFIPTGFLPFSAKIAQIMTNLVGREKILKNDGILDLSILLKKKEEFTWLAKSSFLKDSEKYREEGVVFNFDMIFGGNLDHQIFLGALSSEEGFEVQIFDDPGTYISLRHRKEILSQITFWIEILIKGLRGLEDRGFKETLVKRFCSKMLTYLSNKDSLISSEGDLILVEPQKFSFSQINANGNEDIKHERTPQNSLPSVT